MYAALHDAGIRAEEIGLVSANGSSSIFYDLLEAKAIADCFPEGTPVYSLKGALGQTGAVTPVLQAIAAAKTLTTGLCPPTLNCPDLDPAVGNLNLVREPITRDFENAITHAIGFGGYYYAAQVWSRSQ